MTKLVSLHALILTAVGTMLAENIPPGHVFEASEEETDFLSERDAVRGYVAAQDKALPVFARKTAAEAKQAEATDSATKDQVDISKLNKTDLLAVAAAEQIELKGDETVTQLRDAITAKRNAGPADESLV